MATGQTTDIRTFGSQGQQRSAALALKLAEIEIVKRKVNDTPVLLLDDVLSEWTAAEQNYLLDAFMYSDLYYMYRSRGVCKAPDFTWIRFIMWSGA